MYYGWFAGRMSLDLTNPVHVDDVFVYTEKIGAPATVKVTAEVSNEGTAAFDGEAVIRLFPWYPSESATASVVDRVAVKLDAAKTTTISKTISVPNPLLWDYENPNLYKVTVTLVDKWGKSQDDYVVTTGIRTISEEGGTFRINGKEQVLNGATWMQFLAPFDKSTTWHRCCPESWIVKGILMIRAMEGNTIRKHEASCAYSDPRFAEIGDQLGVMYMWVSTGWSRKHWTSENKNPDGSKMPLDKTVEEFTVDIRQVRNSPSIVMWEIFNESVDKKDRDGLFEAFYPAIYKTDPSRFIMPLKGYYRNEPMVAKGGQIDTLGYAKKWKDLRSKPLDELGKYEKSGKYGMYAVEFAEVTGQDNWDLVKCKPWYKVHSYEWGPVIYKIECSVDGKDMELLITEKGRIISGN
jgi:beta-galactosidase/beta-glucuronidase